MAKLRAISAVVATIWQAAALGASFHVDDFQTPSSTLGWNGGASPTHVADGGPNGAGDGFLRISTTTGGRLATYNSEPAWIGDYNALGAAVVRVDLMSPPQSAPLPIRLVVFGPVEPVQAADRWTSVSAQTIPNDGVWRSYAFSLAASDLTRVQGAGTYQQLMANVVRVMLRYDPGTPTASGSPVAAPGGVLNIDNIELAASPPPLSGDFDEDGDVDADDLNDPVAGWKARFGADLNGDDFLLWQRQFGSGTLQAATIAVPEPLGAGMIVLGGLPLTVGHRFFGRVVHRV